MIFIPRDPTKIPQAWLDKVATLGTKLERLATSEQRKAFIDKHSDIWGEIKEQLLAMSHGKCWYSEAPDAVSDWHVDHFRPKKRAIDEDGTEHEGYHWLAFDWVNYRIAGSYPNSPHRDGYGTTRGKWDYFPLAKNSFRASWQDRSCNNEICLMLDPAKPNDPKLLTFDEEGIPIPADPKNAIVVQKVQTTVHYLFLDSPRLIAARKRKWRETMEWIEEYRRACPNSVHACTLQDYERLERLQSRLSDLTGPESPYAATSRACLWANDLWFLAETPEEARAT